MTSKQENKIRKKKEKQERARLLQIEQMQANAYNQAAKNNVIRAREALRNNEEYRSVEQLFELLLYMMDMCSATAKDLMLKEGVINSHFDEHITALREVTSKLTSKQIDRFDDKSDEQYDGFNELAEFLLESNKLLCDVSVEDRIKVLSTTKLLIK